jgi:hypothetical protein
MSKFNDYLKEEMGQFGWVVLPTVKWYEDPRIKEEEKKELSIEELFNNVKKELNKIKSM